jgi:hypothetical protein
MLTQAKQLPRVQGQKRQVNHIFIKPKKTQIIQLIIFQFLL